MTECSDAAWRERLPDLLHGRLAPAHRAQVEGHVAVCAECRAELALLRQLRTLLAGTASAPVSAAEVATIVGALPAYRHATRARAWRLAAAGLALVAGGASLLVARHAPTAGSRVALAPAGVAVAPAPVAAIRIASAGPHESLASTSGAAHSLARAAGPVTRPARALPVEGAVGDLSDRELQALLSGLGSLRALPSAAADTDNTSLAPASARGAL